MSKDITGTWYLLYEGSSPDGRGFPVYIGRTRSKLIAKKHYTDTAKDPYSNGCVEFVTPTEKSQVNQWTNWEKL